MADTIRTPLVMGDVFRDAGQVLVQRALVMLLLSVALVFTGTAGAAWVRLHPILDGASFWIGLTNGFLNWLVQATPYSLFLAATSWTVAENFEERSPSLGQILTHGLRFFFPVLIVQGLYLLGTMTGAVLLIVPGFIIALMWILATQALVVERLGIVEALKRSRALTKGHRWALLGLTVVYILAVLALEWIVFRITSPSKPFVQAVVAPINAYGVVPVISIFTALLSNTVLTAIYLRLRSGHRASADLTAEVFA